MVNTITMIKSENGIICADKTVKKMFCLSDEPVSISVNSNYIYILTDDSISQYDPNGEMIAELQADYWEDIYASETYLYVNEAECILILPADNISEQMVLDEECLEFHKIAEYAEKHGTHKQIEKLSKTPKAYPRRFDKIK